MLWCTAVVGAVVLGASVSPYLHRDIDLQWYSRLDGVTGYTLQYWTISQLSVQELSVPGQRNFYHLTDLRQGQQYRFQIRALLSNGKQSNWSNVAEASIRGDSRQTSS